LRKQEFEEAGRRPGHRVVAGGIGFAGSLWRGVSGSVGNAVVHAAKAALVVAFLAFTEHSHRQVEQKAEPVFLGVSRTRPPSPLKCPPGKKLMVLEDGNAKCVVKERFELPYCRGIFYCRHSVLASTGKGLSSAENIDASLLRVGVSFTRRVVPKCIQ
jgi:hypothetical protein